MNKTRVITWSQAVDAAGEFLNRLAERETQFPGVALPIMRQWKQEYDDKIAKGELIVLKGE